MLEAVKLVGAIAGLATGAFTIWDRWARGRPLAWVTMEGVPTNANKYIHLKNTGYGDILVLGVRSYPNIFRVAKDHSARGITEASLGQDLMVVLRQNEERDLPFFPQPKILEEAPSARVCFAISWRKTSSSWLPQVPKVIITSTGDLKRMTDALERSSGIV